MFPQGCSKLAVATKQEVENRKNRVCKIHRREICPRIHPVCPRTHPGVLGPGSHRDLTDLRRKLERPLGSPDSETWL